MSTHQEQIKEAVKGNAFYFGSNRELRRLPEHLNRDEVVLSIITGSRLNQRGRGIVVATSERILFIWDGWVFRENQDFPYETISSVEFKTGIFFGVFTMYGLGDETSYNWVGRFAGAKFTKTVRQLVADAKNNQFNQTHRNNSAPASPAISSVSLPATGPDRVMKQLEELNELRDKGLVNINEYEIKKQEILNRL